MKTQLPNKIEVTFTEEDRISAGAYTDTKNCLMATALKRLGYNHDRDVRVHPGVVLIDHAKYLGEVYTHTMKRSNSWHKPYYDSSVVGTTITLTREHVRK